MVKGRAIKDSRACGPIGLKKGEFGDAVALGFLDSTGNLVNTAGSKIMKLSQRANPASKISL